MLYLSCPLNLDIMKPNTPFLLSELTQNIHSPEAISEILDFYSGSKAVEYQNDGIPFILPILENRINDVSVKFSSFEKEFRNTLKLWKAIIEKANNILSSLESLNAIITSANYESNIYLHMQQCKTNFELSNTSLQSIFQSLNEHDFKVSRLNLDYYMHTNKQLAELVKSEEYKPDFIIEQLKNISDELYEYQKSIHWKELRAEIKNILQQIIAQSTNTLDKNSIHNFVQLVIKRKASNPLISDDLVTNLIRLQEDITKFILTFNVSINSIYLSDIKQNALIDNLVVYQLIFKALDINTL